jgi:hypothetical protein
MITLTTRGILLQASVTLRREKKQGETRIVSKIYFAVHRVTKIPFLCEDPPSLIQVIVLHTGEVIHIT